MVAGVPVVIVAVVGCVVVTVVAVSCVGAFKVVDSDGAAVLTVIVVFGWLIFVFVFEPFEFFDGASTLFVGRVVFRIGEFGFYSCDMLFNDGCAAVGGCGLLVGWTLVTVLLHG